jgi:hypothetical protein
MKKLFTCAALSLAALASGCASDGAATASNESASERLYVTGSNIPKKANAKADSNTPMGMGLTVQSREDFEREQATSGPRNPDTLKGR